MPWETTFRVVTITALTGWEVKLNQMVGKTGTILLVKTGERSFCSMSVMWLSRKIWSTWLRPCTSSTPLILTSWSERMRRIDSSGIVLGELELDTLGYDMGDPNMKVPMNKNTVIPEAETHISFSTKLMVMAIDLYEQEAPSEFSPYTIYALKKLRQFVDSRKEITAQSYRFFVEHAYNQFFQHEAFHQSAIARTRVREFGAGEFSTSTKLAGYVWIAGERKMTHVPSICIFKNQSKRHWCRWTPYINQAEGIHLDSRWNQACSCSWRTSWWCQHGGRWWFNGDEGLDELPRLQVVVKPREEQEEKGASSLEREDAQEDQSASSLQREEAQESEGAKYGSSLQKEVPIPAEGSSQKEESVGPKPDLQTDETAPSKEPASRTYNGQDITGYGDNSVLRKLRSCFSDDYHKEWFGFNNKGFPASSTHRHMKYRKTLEPHKDHWYTDSDEQLLAKYIARHRDQLPLEELDEIKNTIEYSCSDLRMHDRHQQHSEEASLEAERRIEDDFADLDGVLQDYVVNHKVLPYCVVLHCLAARYLGGGMMDPTYIDEEYSYRSSATFSLMFWNLGNWCRNRFDKCPVPERFQKFTPHIRYDMDEDHKYFDQDKTLFNNYFINVIKNFGGHLFMNCEAGTLYPHRARLEEAKLSTCFKDYHDLMVAARIGKDGYVRQIAGYNTDESDTGARYVSWAIFEVYWGITRERDSNDLGNLTRSRMQMTRGCVHHVGQKYASDSPGIVGECLATMAFECARYQVDVIAGDGNKACYYTTPKSPGVPTYEYSLIQYWINRMMNVATQARRKNYDPNCPPVRCKHFISCSYRDLDCFGDTSWWSYNSNLHRKTCKEDSW